MKTLLESFPNASKSFLEANEVAKPKENVATGLVGSRRGMNKTEHEFSLMLEARKRAGEIDGWTFEGFKIRLGDGCWYTPDFMSWKRLGQEWDGERWNPYIYFIFYEVKGRHIWDDAKVKFKVAKEQVKWARFELHQKTKEGWKQIL